MVAVVIDTANLVIFTALTSWQKLQFSLSTAWGKFIATNCNAPVRTAIKLVCSHQCQQYHSILKYTVSIHYVYCFVKMTEPETAEWKLEINSQVFVFITGPNKGRRKKIFQGEEEQRKKDQKLAKN